MGGDLTTKEAAIFAFIRNQVRDHGLPPTIREIGKEFGIKSTNGVRYYLDRLVEKGVIRRSGNISRGIEIVEEAFANDESDISAAIARGGIPLVGHVAAGAPILAEENVEEVLFLDGFVAQHNGLFALRVRGESMRDAGILDGDIVVVRSGSDASNGEIVVALLDDEATVKRLDRRPDSVRLLPENPDFEPIELTPEAFAGVRILGRVAAVLRRYE